MITESLCENRFQHKTDVASATQLKTSALRHLKSQLLEQYPLLNTHLDTLLPKKSPIYTLKGSMFSGPTDGSQEDVPVTEKRFFMYSLVTEPHYVFFQWDSLDKQESSIYFPHLRTLQMCNI
jgi:hypothetical protein